MLLSKRSKPPPQPPPSLPPHAEKNREQEQEWARRKMEDRLMSGFQTAAMHEDKALHAKARALIPWDAICDAARSARSNVSSASGDAHGQELVGSAAALGTLARLQAETKLLSIAETARRDVSKLKPLLEEVNRSDPCRCCFVMWQPWSGNQTDAAIV